MNSVKQSITLNKPNGQNVIEYLKHLKRLNKTEFKTKPGKFDQHGMSVDKSLTVCTNVSQISFAVGGR